MLGSTTLTRPSVVVVVVVGEVYKILHALFVIPMYDMHAVPTITRNCMELFRRRRSERKILLATKRRTKKKFVEVRGAV